MIEEIDHTLKVLKSGGIILYPADTIWGIGCDATNAKAVKKIIQIKKRRKTKSFIILLDTPFKLSMYVKKVPDIAYDLIEKFDNPLSIIYPDAQNLAKNVIAEDGSVAIRIVKNEFCKNLINLLNKPIVSTSANISRESDPVSFGKISEKIKNNVDYIVNLDRDRVYELKTSTLIRINETGDFTIIRQ